MGSPSHIRSVSHHHHAFCRQLQSTSQRAPPFHQCKCEESIIVKLTYDPSQDLPEEEYDYQLLPVIGDDGSVLPFYHKGALVQDPRRNLLHIKSRVHPCFVIPTLLRYKATGRSEKLFPNPITDAMDTLVSIYLSVTHLPVYLSWLGPKETWTQFRRSFILAKPDPPSHRASRYDMPHLPIASPASRKRKDAGSRKPSSERSHSSTKKSVHFIGTPATKRKKRSSESTKPGTTGMTTRRTVRSR